MQTLVSFVAVVNGSGDDGCGGRGGVVDENATVLNISLIYWPYTAQFSSTRKQLAPLNENIKSMSAIITSAHTYIDYYVR